MGLETGTSISALDNSWPLSGDFIQAGDDHLRLIKSVLKAQFPGAGGQGFSTPITASEAEINFSDGVTSGIQAQLDAIAATVGGVQSFPTGTIMLFYQAAAPTGWTQIAGDDNSMLRMVSGAGDAGGAFGGTDSPILFEYDHDHATSGHTLTVAEIPSHRHSGNADEGSSGAGISAPNFRREGGNTGFLYTNYTGGGGSHSHGVTALSTTPMSITPRYVNIIQASKD
jgi:hypothetical protein